jgi:hypothetical protein
VTSVAIYMEGGGDSHHARAALRQGMTEFLKPLKDAARVRSWRWKLVCCGGRQEAFNAFVHAVRTGDNTVAALLVDAEGAVTEPPRAHLRARDGWDLCGTPDEVLHLMVQTMETWIVADTVMLATYYGQHFNANPLPKTVNLETVPQTQIASSLRQATRATQKGAYHKIRHASDLLQRIDRQVVQRRCPSCTRLFDTLGHLIATA